jgi:transglycosylase-like protein with SLT domain
MKTRRLTLLLAAGLVMLASLTTATLPAAAQEQTVWVQLPTGEIVPVTVDIPPGGTLKDVQLPGTPVPPPAETTPAAPPTPTTPTAPAPRPPTAPRKEPDKPAPEPKRAEPKSPRSGRGSPKRRTDSGVREDRSRRKEREPQDQAKRRDEKREKRENGKKDENGKKGQKGKKDQASPQRRHERRGQRRRPDGTPTPRNPGLMDPSPGPVDALPGPLDALPGPSTATGVPNFIIRKFRVPPFLLSIYQAAGIEYGIRWEVLAAINEIETDYGRNLNVSSAGAVGWMQFMPATWAVYGIDANKDGRKDPYNPVDAIFAAARYLKAAGYERDVRAAIFAYNHADWYVDSVLLRARLIAGVPADLIGALTGLTEGRFPVSARARYADDLAAAELLKRVRQGENAANVVESADDRRSIDIYARAGAPVVAVNDGVVKRIGRNERLGRFVVLQDVYGNRYTYSQLGSISRVYPVPKRHTTDPAPSARALKANEGKALPKPSKPASAGRQLDDSDLERERDRGAAPGSLERPRPIAPVKRRLFAHPGMDGARQAGGLEQILDAQARERGLYATYRNYFARPFRLHPSKVTLRRLRKGSRVIGGTIIGRLGATAASRAPHLDFAIRPAGDGAPMIDPKPILDGWKLLEATAIYRASGRNVLYGDEPGGLSIGQILLLPKPQLERRVLADERIEIYKCGRDDIRSGQIDRRVLATLAYMAESGLRPSVSSLKCGHSYYTKTGSVSHHSSGNAVDISKINGVPISGHQERGGITEQTVRRLMLLQGTLAPAQIISLFEVGGATLAMSDHHDHIHVGFTPMFGANEKLGKQALAVLEPGQWSDLIVRLRDIDNPVVPTKPSRYSLPAKKDRRASKAHRGE